MASYEMKRTFEELEPDFELLDKLLGEQQKAYIRRRLGAIRLLWEGCSRKEVCQRCQVSYRSIISWVKVIAENGVTEGLQELAKSKKSEKPGKLTPWQQLEVIRILQEDSPSDYGYTKKFFTGRILVELVKEKWGIKISRQGIYDLLYKYGFSYQKDHRDDESFSWINTSLISGQLKKEEGRMTSMTNYRCLLCGRDYEFNDVSYVCPSHGAVGSLDVCYDYEAIRQATTPKEIARSKRESMWRYLPLLPVQDETAIPPLGVGWTPLYHAPRLGQQIGVPDLWVKDDGRNPTASFKDRASAMAVVRARELGYKTITTASTGNAAAALAGMAASVGMRAVIFVPKSAPEAKIAQLLVYGADVYLVNGTYDDAFELCLAATDEMGWYCRNTGYNPFMTEGKKTVSYEIAEQLGWQAPDVVVVSVGDGCIIGGVHKGFYDLAQLGWTDKMPRLIGAQAAGSDACLRAWQSGTNELSRITATTRADSISADFPRDGHKAVRAVRETGGAFVRVSDEQIMAAIPELAQGSGVFAEPAAAAAWAGAKQARKDGLIAPHERVVVISTGSGLKDVAAAIASVGEARVIEKDVAALRAVLRPG